MWNFVGALDKGRGASGAVLIGDVKARGGWRGRDIRNDIRAQHRYAPAESFAKM